MVSQIPQIITNTFKSIKILFIYQLLISRPSQQYQSLLYLQLHHLGWAIMGPLIRFSNVSMDWNVYISIPDQILKLFNFTNFTYHFIVCAPPVVYKVSAWIVIYHLFDFLFPHSFLLSLESGFAGKFKQPPFMSWLDNKRHWDSEHVYVDRYQYSFTQNNQFTEKCPRFR